MFAKRTSWDIKVNKITQLLNELKSNQVQVIDLTVSNPTLVELNYPVDDILDALVSAGNIKYEPDPKGLIQARISICKYYEGIGINLNPDQIIITSGSSEAYNFIFRLVTEPGDEILVPTPSYPLLQHLADINDIRINYYRLNYDGEWHIDLDTLRKSISERTRIIVCINPNNPTGSYLKSSEYEQIIEMAAEKKIIILSDEVFWGYKIDEDLIEIKTFSGCKEIPNFVINGISKLLGLPQMKLGWIIANGPDNFKEEALSKLEIISDTFLSVCIPVQNAMSAWFLKMRGIQQEIRSRLITNHNYLRKRLMEGLPIQMYRVEGGWNVILRLPNILRDDEWVEIFLRNAGVFVHPGYFFDMEFESCIILSLLVKPALFQMGVEKIFQQVSRF